MIESDIRNSRLGVYFAFIIAMTAIIGGIICAIQDKQIAASFIGGSGIAGIISVFIYGTTMRRKERTEKLKELTRE
ncbi:MAG: hypothetical protein AB1546_01720 [bacterium]